MSILTIDAPEHYWDLLPGVPPDIMIADPTDDHIDLAHIFIRDESRLIATLRGLRPRIAPAGMIWVSWPKKSARTGSTVTEDTIREAALAAGLVDVKVCAVDAVWSGLKLVIRLADRT